MANRRVDRRGLTSIGIGLLMLVAGCAPRTPAAPPIAQQASHLFTDDFTQPSSAWARFDTDTSAIYALAGELYLEDRGQGTAVYTPLVGENHRDVDIEVSLRHVQGSVNNWMGVLCRQQDEENYYLFAISADGYYLVLNVVEGEQTPLAGPQYSEVIRNGKAENQLRARCQGPGLYLWVNDTRLAAEVDSTLEAAGNVGLIADAVQQGETAVTAFDNFVLSAP